MMCLFRQAKFHIYDLNVLLVAFDHPLASIRLVVDMIGGCTQGPLWNQGKLLSIVCCSQFQLRL